MKIKKTVYPKEPIRSFNLWIKYIHKQAKINYAKKVAPINKVIDNE